MSFVSKMYPMCENCGKALRMVYGSQEWHAKNDPPGGYCRCARDGLFGSSMAQDAPGAAKADSVQPSSAASALPIDAAIQIATAYDKEPSNTPTDLRAAAAALADEVQRPRGTAAP